MNLSILVSIQLKLGNMEGETRERDVQGRKVVGFLEHIMKYRTVTMAMKTSET